jgi:MOSC domain-containing protein YiiM
MNIKHLTMAELKAGLDEIRKSPRDAGLLELIVQRPRTDERSCPEEGELSLEVGLVGDSWSTRTNKPPHPEKQLNLMNSRAIALIAGVKERWQLAGDQLYIDLDLSNENLQPGSQIAIGKAIIEITEPPHNGCKKFTERFGLDAVKFVNSPVGKELHLRGLNAKVVQPGRIRVGDMARKI